MFRRLRGEQDLGPAAVEESDADLYQCRQHAVLSLYLSHCDAAVIIEGGLGIVRHARFRARS
jgi:hypothetical protein